MNIILALSCDAGAQMMKFKSPFPADGNICSRRYVHIRANSTLFVSLRVYRIYWGPSANVFVLGVSWDKSALKRTRPPSLERISFIHAKRHRIGYNSTILSVSPICNQSSENFPFEKISKDFWRNGLINVVLNCCFFFLIEARQNSYLEINIDSGYIYGREGNAIWLTLGIKLLLV